MGTIHCIIKHVMLDVVGINHSHVDHDCFLVCHITNSFMIWFLSSFYNSNFKYKLNIKYEIN